MMGVSMEWCCFGESNENYMECEFFLKSMVEGKK
jgi:hypothetical protein